MTSALRFLNAANSPVMPDALLLLSGEVGKT